MSMSHEEEKSQDCVLTVLKSLKNLKADDGFMQEDHAQFISNMLENKFIKNLLALHQLLNKNVGKSQRKDNIKLCMEILTTLEKEEKDEKCQQLAKIVMDPYFRCLIEAHDNILYETYKMIPSLSQENSLKGDMSVPPIRVVGLTRKPNEPLGITLGKHRDDCIYIQRILHGTMVEKQGLLTVGDVLQEINGEAVDGDPRKVQEKMQSLTGSITIKVIPVNKDARGICQVFVRCHFNYNPKEDKLFPEHDTGLSFKRGDILEIIDQSDPDWWQAHHLDDHENTGIIPSLKFEQTRRAVSSVKHKQDSTSGGLFKKKKKIMYRTSESKLLDCLDVRLYEEVTRMPPMERKVIVLIGAQGVGRKGLKNRLQQTYPDRYQEVTRDTSREPREGEEEKKGYNFLKKELMMADISSGKYFEWGQYQGHFYGTTLDGVRSILQNGKMCIIDVDPSALKLLKTAEFMPLVVFVEAPKLQVLVKNNQSNGLNPKTSDELKAIVRESNEISESYNHYFDLRIVNEDMEQSFTTLREHIDKLAGEPQWVPISWVY